MMDKFVDTFKEESYELLGQLEQRLLVLEEDPTDKEKINNVYRVMHTIKGSAGMFGFESIASFTHEVENILTFLREGKISVSKKLIDLTLRARDTVLAMLDSEGGEQDPAFEAEKAGLIEELKTLLPGASKTERPSGPAEKKKEAESRRKEETTFRVSFTPHSDIFLTGTKPILLLKELRDLGEYTCVGHTEGIPPLSEFEPEKCYVHWEVILTTQADTNTIKDVFIFVENTSQIEITPVGDIPEILKVIQGRRLGEILVEKKLVTQDDLEKALNAQKRIGEVLVEKKVISSLDLKAALEEQQHLKKLKEKKDAALSASSIRVSSEKLDQLVDLVGELVTIQARLTQTASLIDNAELTSLTEQVEHLSSELRDTAMGLRMLPIGTTFSKFARLVRDLSAELGKEIVMETEGAETELDKNVIEKLNDPLVHIIRNSIDHGIEPPSEREAKGNRGKARYGSPPCTREGRSSSRSMTMEPDLMWTRFERKRSRRGSSPRKRNSPRSSSTSWSSRRVFRPRRR
jgi:two-component system chemotaxis sensor kinase CheA